MQEWEAAQAALPAAPEHDEPEYYEVPDEEEQLVNLELSSEREYNILFVCSGCCGSGARGSSSGVEQTVQYAA